MSLVRDVIGVTGDEAEGPPGPGNLGGGKPTVPPGRSAPFEGLHRLANVRGGMRPTQEKLSYAPPLRVLLPVSEREELDDLVVKLAGELGTRVKLSHVVRSCLTLLRRSEEQILKRAGRARGLVRPTNHETIALAEFEDALTDLIDAAFHDKPIPR